METKKDRDMDNSTKLLTLADACSDALLGGECGWMEMDFNRFVSECRRAIAYGVRCKNAGLVPPPRINRLPNRMSPDAEMQEHMFGEVNTGDFGKK